MERIKDDLCIPCSLAARYIVLEYRTKVRSSMYNVSQMRTSGYHEIFRKGHHHRQR